MLIVKTELHSVGPNWDKNFRNFSKEIFFSSKVYSATAEPASLCLYACTGVDLESYEKEIMNGGRGVVEGKDKTYVTKKGAEEYNKRSGRYVEREVEGES